MIRYILKRLGWGIPVILGVTLVTFFLFNYIGNPVYQFLGKSASPEDIAALERQYGLDQPFYIQYLDYLKQIVTFDFGRSFNTKEPVAEMVLRAAGPSLSLTLPALLCTTVIAVSIGLVAAAFRGRKTDRALMFAAVAGMSVSFLVYIVLGQYLLAYKFPAFHIHGYEGGLLERWEYLILPMIIIVIVGIGYDTRFYRAVMIEEVTRDHVRTARAKGATPARVLFRHVLKNAMIPIITRVMISVPFLITGSVLLESFFGIPGLGGTLLAALNTADFPVIKAITVLISVVFVLSIIANDVLYALVDPRVRLE